MVAMGPAFLFSLFQAGGCIIHVILHKISTTGTSSGRNKKEVAVFNTQWPL